MTPKPEIRKPPESDQKTLVPDALGKISPTAPKPAGPPRMGLFATPGHQATQPTQAGLLIAAGAVMEPLQESLLGCSSELPHVEMLPDATPELLHWHRTPGVA